MVAVLRMRNRELPMVRHEGLRFRPKVILSLLLLAAALAVVMSRTQHGSELPVYMKAAERLVQGERIYRPESVVLTFTYPPFFALPHVLLLPLSPAGRIYAWWFVNLGLTMTILWILGGSLRPMVGRLAQVAGPPVWLAILMVAILSGRFLLSPLEYQSHDLIVFLLVLFTGVAMARDTDVWAGACAGLATACKATPLLLLPQLCWQRRYRGAVAFVAALLLATCLPDMLFPSADGRLWVSHWNRAFVAKIPVGEEAHAAGAWVSWNCMNQSLSGAVYRLSTPIKTQDNMVNVCLWPLEGTPRRLLTIAVQLAILAWLAWATRRRRPGGANLDPAFVALGQVGMATCAMLLLSPMSSAQHFCVLVVPITVCVVHWLYVRRDPVVGLALLAVFVFGTLTAHDFIGRYFSDLCQAFGCKTLCALALLLATGRVLLAEGCESGVEARAPLLSAPQPSLL